MQMQNVTVWKFNRFSEETTETEIDDLIRRKIVNFDADRDENGIVRSVTAYSDEDSNGSVVYGIFSTDFVDGFFRKIVETYDEFR